MNLTDEQFELMSKELNEVLAKHGVEIIIRSELTFKKIDETNQPNPEGEEATKAD